ncbi:MAG TPA: nuclear transport factor 2 family protein [Puia sp.]|jgi:hypothetical protein
MSTSTFPIVIQQFIDAVNRHDGDGFIETFADDALVNDFARSFWGKGAIKKWGDKEIIGDQVTFTPDQTIEHYGEWVITALTDGKYDKTKAPDPTYLDYFFTVRGNVIVKLIITKNKEKSAK